MPYSSKDVSIEVLFAQRLASNLPKVRDRHVKKLSKFLEAKAIAAAAGRGALNEDELLKLWKGLHYCYWMSDKPLVQEELAERISHMVHVFSAADADLCFLPFAKSGLVTLGREWFGLDKWRVDKFMLLLRRFLRQIFIFAKNTQWSITQKLVEVFEETVLARDSRSPPALGFQLHFVDVFLEELAKVDGGDDGLGQEVIRVLLQPFVAQLRKGQEERLSSHVEDRIFQHLMRQSDVGIAYEQGDEDEEEEEEEDEEDDDGGEDAGDEGGREDRAENDAEMASDESDQDIEGEDENGDEAGGPLDPRAGRVDVTVPQLMADYVVLSDDLFKAGSGKEVGHRQRKQLYRLSKQFRALSEGRYPLAPDFTEDGEEGVDNEELPRVDLKRAKRAKENEERSRRETEQRERKEYKASMAARRKQGGQQSSAHDQEEEDDDAKGSDSGVEDASPSDDEVEEAVTNVKDKRCVEAASEEANDGRSAKKTKLKKKGKGAETSRADGLGDDTVDTAPKIASHETIAKGDEKRSKRKKKRKKAQVHAEQDDAAKALEETAPLIPAMEVSPKMMHAHEEQGASSVTLAKKNRKRKLVQDNSLDASLPIGKDEAKHKNKSKKAKLATTKGHVEIDDAPQSPATLSSSTAKSKESKTHADAAIGEKKKKKSKAKAKSLSPVTKRESLPSTVLPGGSSPPKIKSAGSSAPTPVFIRKAASKVAQKSSSAAAKTTSPSRKTPTPAKGKKKKQINFAGNRYQSVLDHSMSIQESPDIPFEPGRRPKQGLLKNKDDISVVQTPSPVAAARKEVHKNTRMNEKVGKKSLQLMKNRMVASDFF